MFIVTRSPKIALASLAVSLLIFAVMYFTVIKPSTDTANNAVHQSLQNASQTLKQDGVGNTAAGRNAQKLTDCLLKAGTDSGKLQACQAQFGQ